MKVPPVVQESAQRDEASPQLLNAVERAMAEMRRGVPVLVYEEDQGCALIQAAETASDQALDHMKALAGGNEPSLVLTARRAAAIGIDEAKSMIHGREATGDVIGFDLAQMPVEQISCLVDPLHDPAGRNLIHEELLSIPLPEKVARNAVQLVKLASLLPSVLFADLSSLSLDGPGLEAFARKHDLLFVSASEIARYRAASAYALKRVATARVPLEIAEKVTVVAFRPTGGGVEHMALLVGDPKPGEPVLARLHSECFTGDLLGSLRCDCGDQLRGAIAAMDQAGAGVLLYLSQEGRGIGLMNKLRAYELQDRGSDTMEANELVGFDPDERIYIPAAEILRQLGFDAVRLMTNNPDKVAELKQWGVNVVERVEHFFPSNGHNEFYLKTKVERFGHML